MSEEMSNWIIIVILSLYCLVLSVAFHAVYFKWKKEKHIREKFEGVLHFYAQNDITYYDTELCEQIPCSGFAKQALFLRQDKHLTLKEFNDHLNQTIQ